MNRKKSTTTSLFCSALPFNSKQTNRVMWETIADSWPKSGWYVDSCGFFRGRMRLNKHQFASMIRNVSLDFLFWDLEDRYLWFLPKLITCCKTVLIKLSVDNKTSKFGRSLKKYLHLKMLQKFWNLVNYIGPRIVINHAYLIWIIEVSVQWKIERNFSIYIGNVSIKKHVTILRWIQQ
jgi:hypothetical protein